MLALARLHAALACFVVVMVGLAPSARAQGRWDEKEDCQPPCRKGYVCRDGECVSACNPACPAGRVCRDNDCVPEGGAAVPAARAAPARRALAPGCYPECAEGEVCARGRCVAGDGGARGGAEQTRDYEPAQAAPRYKSVGGALALELFIGFGAGNFYAGAYGFGALGAVSSVMLYAGVVGFAVHQNLASVVVIVLGSVGHVAATIAAPLYAARHNRKLRARSLARELVEPLRAVAPGGRPEGRGPALPAPRVALMAPILRW